MPKCIYLRTEAQFFTKTAKCLVARDAGAADEAKALTVEEHSTARTPLRPFICLWVPGERQVTEKGWTDGDDVRFCQHADSAVFTRIPFHVPQFGILSAKQDLGELRDLIHKCCKLHVDFFFCILGGARGLHLHVWGMVKQQIYIAWSFGRAFKVHIGQKDGLGHRVKQCII